MLLALAAAACLRRAPEDIASPLAFRCSAPMVPYVRTSLYFDRANTSEPDRPYSEAEWERFIKEVLIRYVPDGGTVFDNTGWWRRPDGTTFRGIGRTLLVLAPAPDSASHRASVDSVTSQIKQRYGHRLVIREEALVCAAF